MRVVKSDGIFPVNEFEKTSKRSSVSRVRISDVKLPTKLFWAESNFKEIHVAGVRDCIRGISNASNYIYHVNLRRRSLVVEYGLSKSSQSIPNQKHSCSFPSQPDLSSQFSPFVAK